MLSFAFDRASLPVHSSNLFLSFFSPLGRFRLRFRFDTRAIVQNIYRELAATQRRFFSLRGERLFFDFIEDPFRATMEFDFEKLTQRTWEAANGL